VTTATAAALSGKYNSKDWRSTRKVLKIRSAKSVSMKLISGGLAHGL
jgi:hypothetical protein